MSLLDRAKADIERITGNANEWGRSMVMEAPTGETVTVTGLTKKHHAGFDTDGARVNAKDASITISEKYLGDYPVRNAAGEVSLTDHKVTVKDSTGIDKNYVIREWFPDETIGLIVCILGDYTE